MVVGICECFACIIKAHVPFTRLTDCSRDYFLFVNDIFQFGTDCFSDKLAFGLNNTDRCLLPVACLC